MKQTPRLNSLDQLMAKQASLRAEQQQLSRDIIKESKTAAISLPVVSLIKPADPLKILKVNGQINPPAKLFSYLLPIIVNGTLFRRSGFMTRIITALIARKIGRRFGPKITFWLLDLILKYTRNRQQPKLLR
ncbi:MAG: hypothetical protein V4594_11645 [Bacteroidota bacterium]